MRPQDVLTKQNLPGGTSAVVPPDPMPNSEVKRRSADGSVGSPHVRVGNCQASNKTKGSVERLGLLFLRFNKNPVPKDAGFFAVWGMPPRWRCAYRGYGSWATKPGAQHRLQADHYASSLLSAIIITLIGYLYIALSNTMVYLLCALYQCIALLTEIN